MAHSASVILEPLSLGIPLDKKHMVALARERYEDVYQPRVESLTGGCLLWSAAMQWVLRREAPNIKTMITAGTMCFRFRTEENDDGVGPTHFSYMFELMPAVARASDGLLPEMHVWLVLNPESRNDSIMELVDLTTGFQPAQLKKMLGQEWDEELLPPPYIWCKAKDIPKQFIYKSEPVARAIAMGFLEDFHARHGLERTWR